MVLALQELAQRLLAAYDARTPGQLPGEPLDLTTAQAYALQAEITRLREQRGEKVIGYKVGCTSKPIQVQLSVMEPIFGRLFDTECHHSGEHLAAARYANLAVEAEMAVRLSRDLPSEPLSAEAYWEAIAEVFPVIELHHYVLPAAWPPGLWLIASNGLHAGLVLPGAPTGCADLANVAHNLSIRIKQGMVEDVADAVPLNVPIDSLRWLAGRLAQFGLQPCKGQVILTGSPMKLFPVTPDSRIVVEAPPLGASWVEIDP